MDISIRNLTPGNIDVGVALLDAAYGPSRGRAAALCRYLSLDSEGWLLAFVDETPAGMLGAVDYGRFAYLGMMAVHPTMQRRGIGLLMMERVLDWLEDRGCLTTFLDATEAGVPLYSKVGFVDEELTYRFHPVGPARLEGSDRVRRIQASDIAALADLDAPVFGTRREKVLEVFLSEFPDRAFLSESQDGQVSGYVFVQQQNIGPWVAQTPEDAESLLVAALSLPYDGAPRIIVPEANRSAPCLLERYGFRQQLALRRMRRGPPWQGERSQMYGQASFVIG